ncbi:MAG: winged helix-turn-helix transcriptional regulator [Deltaproteobacteria bacterium]|nr:winged helix-turn-helix transcriptional regulator [Candidatus Tharpella aukensis]
MITIRTLKDITTLSESVDLECKLAVGRDGKGQLPVDFWPTYSAFVNTRGGTVLLGIKEKQGRFSLHGVDEPERIISDLFNLVNNPNKVSTNLLTDHHVQVFTIAEKNLIQIDIPTAPRQQKPVYLNGNPLKGNTFRRLHAGDRPCDDETVKRMLAEQMEDSRDIRILPAFTLADLDSESLHAYRNMLASHRPEHPWTSMKDQDFLLAFGGYRHDRQTDDEGLTLAGLLMFGKWPAIQEGVPNYFVDYQEQPEDKTSETRWLDRVVPDGTWSGNLFDFFRKVSRKLVADLKVPFVLKGNFRQDDTLQHRALREALVNTLVHADHTGRASILVIKDPKGFRFRNPGLLRVPVEQALRGGESDCRNQTLQQMFLMINLGERAGSGLPKIRQAWEPEGGTLHLFDSFEPYDQTRLEMTLATKMSVTEKTPEKTPEKTLEKTLEKTSVTGKMTGKMTGKILELLSSDPTLTIPELATNLGVSESTVERAIRELKKVKRLQRSGSRKKGSWKVIDDQ